jgi:HlyD family secretion protein
MKRAAVIVAIVVVVAAGGVWLARTLSTGAQSGAAPEAAPPPDPAADVIWASGKLVPVQWTGLSTSSAGTVRTVRVGEGDRVRAGDVLLELNSAALQSQMDVAAAALAEAQAARDKLLAPATTEQIAQAEAGVAVAGADVASAQAAVESAKKAAAAAASQAQVAQAQYNELASRPSPAEKVAAQAEIDLAQNAVKLAQQAYDRVSGDVNIVARPEALALEQATVRLGAAQAAYEAAAQGATPQQLVVARAQIAAAQAQTQIAASQVPSAESAVQAAQAQLARTEAALQALRAGPTREDKAVAESRVASARAALASADAQLRETRVVAPFSGQVGTVNVRPGEMAVPGDVLLMLGDTSKLRVETTDLRETDVRRLAVGMPAEVTFDALPGRTFQGTVTRIATMSTTDKGSTNYTLVVEVSDLDPALRWGMTAFVNLRGQH